MGAARRDEFSIRVKRTIASRVAMLCTNPGCRAVTAGPQTHPAESINIGVAAHMSAAAAGGPRYNPTLTPRERSGVGNAIWLCQNCAKLVDTDADRFSEAVLLKWKRDAELEAKHQLGRRRVGKSRRSAEVKQKLSLKRRMEKDFAKYKRGEIIIHSDEDQIYPELWDRPGISNWFKVEWWGLYHNGFELALSLEEVAVTPDGRWAFVPFRMEDKVAKKIKVLQIGRIPFRNIVNYDLGGDEYYPVPHLYCHFADNGQPYETIVAELADSPYRQRLDQALKVPFKEIAELVVAKA